MHLTVARISYELAQWQSERTTQNHQIETPADETFIDRHRRLRLVDYVLCGWTFSVWQTHSVIFPKDLRQRSRFPDLSRRGRDRRHRITGVDDTISPVCQLTIVHRTMIRRY